MLSSATCIVSDSVGCKMREKRLVTSGVALIFDPYHVPDPVYSKVRKVVRGPSPSTQCGYLIRTFSEIGRSFHDF